MNRVNTLKTVLWAIVGLAVSVGITRFLFGLGATTNLTDTTPWGLWISFDVFSGVALAAGGFVITAIVYILKRDEFQPLVKPAVLTAFLGYVAVIIGLMFDLGLPWNIWHMIVFWNPHSPLFEVGWCVMLYTTVLLLEFSPVPLEKTSRYAKVREFLMKFRFPLVLLGIMLSTLHQSSLGSLFLIMPFKLYPLWYSNILPILFFVSAVGLGFAMITLESLISSYLYKRKNETDILSKFLKIAFWVLGLYFVIRITDIIISDKVALIFSGTWESVLFILELLISVIIPMILFGIGKIRRHPIGQWIGSSLVVFGFVFNRINISGLTMLRVTGDSYIPSWMEVAVSAGVVSIAVLIFLYSIEKFNVWKVPPKDPNADPLKKPEFDRLSEVWLGNPNVTARTTYSLIFIFALSLGFTLIPYNKLHSDGIPDVLVEKARGGDKMFIDGNRDRYGVLFDHKNHIEMIGDDEPCAYCHHMNIPMDENSGCYECHSDMFKTATAFDHEWHQTSVKANLRCFDCHTEGMEKTAYNVKKCQDCHNDLIPENSELSVDDYKTLSYCDAMHTLCVKCHKQKAQTVEDKKDLALCKTCHKSEFPDYLKVEIQENLAGPYFNRVVLPIENLRREKTEE